MRHFPFYNHFHSRSDPKSLIGRCVYIDLSGERAVTAVASLIDTGDCTHWNRRNGGASTEKQWSQITPLIVPFLQRGSLNRETGTKMHIKNDHSHKRLHFTNVLFCLFLSRDTTYNCPRSSHRFFAPSITLPAQNAYNYTVLGQMTQSQSR